jgi:hypothetical protein
MGKMLCLIERIKIRKARIFVGDFLKCGFFFRITDYTDIHGFLFENGWSGLNGWNGFFENGWSGLNGLKRIY